MRSAVAEEGHVHGQTVHSVAGLFAAMDTDGDGVLSFLELHAALRDLGISLPKAREAALFAAADRNRDHVIQLSEFVQLLRRR